MRDMFYQCGAVAKESLSVSGKVGHRASSVLEPEDQKWPAVTKSTSKTLQELWGRKGCVGADRV